ncbi:MAG TPA: hypothetical protein VGQ37_13155 [Vicinamibacterales bacterium]|nr:hypothetical protein [Vicinamibacterales bacterium]
MWSLAVRAPFAARSRDSLLQELSPATMAKRTYARNTLAINARREGLAALRGNPA